MAQRSLDEAKREAERLCQELKVEGGVAQPQQRSDFALRYAWRENLHWALRQQRETVCRREGEVNEMWLVLLAATKEREALGRLKTRQANAYTARAQLLEERHIDESNIRVRNVAARGH